MTRLLREKLTRFSVAGAANTAVGLSTIFIAKALFGINDVWANLSGYGVGMILSFVLNKNWTFGYRHHSVVTFIQFVGVLLFAYLLNLATLLACVEMGANSYLAQIFGVLCYAIFSYVAMDRYVFSSRPHQSVFRSGSSCRTM